MFKFQAEIDLVKGCGGHCPPASAVAVARDAWRWVASPVTADCFKPVAIRNPPRFHQENGPEKQCSCWALSMHDSEAQSIAAFRALERNFRKIRKTLGTAVAYAKIDVDHGQSTPSDDYGHFDLHPFHDCSLEVIFAIAKAIP
jgi:hypothetical protein